MHRSNAEAFLVCTVRKPGEDRSAFLNLAMLHIGKGSSLLRNHFLPFLSVLLYLGWWVWQTERIREWSPSVFTGIQCRIRRARGHSLSLQPKTVWPKPWSLPSLGACIHSRAQILIQLLVLFLWKSKPHLDRDLFSPGFDSHCILILRFSESEKMQRRLHSNSRAC